MSIKIPSNIEKLDPTDPYHLVDGKDVAGFSELKTQADATANTVATHTASIQQMDADIKATVQTLESDIHQKIEGIHVEDIHNNAYDDINSVHYTNATLTYDGQQQVSVHFDKPLINVSNGQSIGSISANVEDLEFPGAIITTRNEGKIGVVTIQSGGTSSTGISVTADGQTYTNQSSLELTGFTAQVVNSKLVLTPPSSSGGTYNLVLDDGSSSIGGITKIEVPTSKLVDKTGGVVELTPRVSFQNVTGGNDTVSAHTVNVMTPLKVEASKNNPAGTPDPDQVTLIIDPAAYERQHTASFLGYLSEDTNVVGKIHTPGSKRKGSLWFDDIVYDSVTYIQLVRDKKLIGIQEYDGGDPNITGGTAFLIAFRVNMKGTAPEDGIVKVYLNEFDELERDIGIMSDANGQPLAFERVYKAGEKLGALDVVGIVKAEALRYFSCNVEDNFADAYLTLTDPTEGVTGLMVQALIPNEKTGPALLQFEADTNQDISFSSHYMGPERADLAWLIRSNSAPAPVPAGTGLTLGDGYGIYNPTELLYGTENDRLKISDNGSTITDFNLHRIFSAEETVMMHDKGIDVTVTLTNKDMAFRVALVKWIGIPDAYTPEIYKTRTNDALNLLPNWVIVSELFISEDIDSEDRVATKQFTIPTDANNYAIMLYPVTAQQPLTLLLKDIRVDVTDPFIGYVVHFSEMDRERALAFSKQQMTLYQDNQGYGALRYTINNTDQPMPIGELGKGLADVGIDTTLNTIAGSVARGGEGGVEFKVDGKITVTTALRLWNEKGTNASVVFWYELVDIAQQRGTKIDASEITLIVHAGAKATQFYMPTFSVDVTTGQRLILRVRGNSPDCAFLQSVSPSAPMIYTTLTFEEYASGSYDDPFSGIDLSHFTNVRHGFATADIDFTNKASMTIPINIPDDVDLVILGAIKENADLSVESVAKLGWRYSNTTKTLSVSFGETVPVGRIILGISA